MLSRTMRFLRSPVVIRTIRSWAAYAALPLVGIVTAPLLARALGPEGRGQLAAVLQPLSVADAFVAFGVPAAVTFFVARGVSAPVVRRYAHRFLLGSSVVVGSILFWYSDTISLMTGLPREWIILIWTSTILGAFVASRRSMWQGLQRFSIIDAERSLAAATRLSLIVALCLIGVASALFFSGAYVLSGLIASVLLWRKLPKIKSGGGTRKFDISGKSFVKYSTLASLGTIAMTLNNRLDQAVLPAAVSARELGFYSVAVTVAEIPIIISTVMARNLLAESSAKAGRKTIIRTGMTGLIGVMICCGLLAASVPWLIPLVFGSAYNDSIGLTQLLLVGTVLGTASMAMSVVLTGNGFPGLGSVGPATSAAATAVILWILWGSVTVERAAIIAIAAQGISCIVTGCILIYKSRRDSSATRRSPDALSVI